MTKPVQNIIPTGDQTKRRTTSEIFCNSRGIPLYQNPNALFVESAENVTLRTKDEVVDRAIALCFCELKSEEAEAEMLADFEQAYNAMPKFTPAEKEFAVAENPTEQQMINANWRAEGFHVMLWALGYVDELKYPDEVCNVEHDVPHLFTRTEEEFREEAVLRSKEEILDAADLILRLNWACVNARVNGQPAPAGMDKSVVYERHYALNWLTKWNNQEWDNVTTDT